MKADDQVSFIIPHKGRFDMLIKTLQSISEQSYPLENIEVIVVSQTPEIQETQLTDNTQLPLRVVVRPESETISALRNHGVAQTQGKYLAFLDADIFISPNWVNCMLEQLHNAPNRVIVSAMQICEPSASPLEQVRTSLSNIVIDTNVAILPGRNLFLTRTTFEEIGGFPEHLVTSEDSFFTDKATNLGELYYTSEATYIHLGEDKTLPELFRKEIWRGQSNLQSIRGRKIPLREIPSFVLPFEIYLSFLGSIISLSLQAYPYALLFFVLGLIPILAYSFRLYCSPQKGISFSWIFKFYTTYFLARAVGIVAGLFKNIRANYD